MSAAGRSQNLPFFFFLSSVCVGDVRTTSRKPLHPSAPLFLCFSVSHNPNSWTFIKKKIIKPGMAKGGWQSPALLNTWI